MHKFLYAFLLLLLPGLIQAQFTQPYHLRASKDVPIVATAAGLLMTSFFLKKNKQLYTEAEIRQFDMSGVNKFDRNACRNWSPMAAKFSDALMYGSMAMPFALVGNENIRKDYGRAVLIGLETFLVNVALTSFTKEMVKRKRPFMYNPEAPLSRKMKKDATSSFFSGHTSVAASMAFLTAKSYADYNPGSSYKGVVWATAAIIPALTGFLRWKAGKHFWTDILTGYLVGTAVGILIPAIHNQNLRLN